MHQVRIQTEEPVSIGPWAEILGCFLEFFLKLEDPNIAFPTHYEDQLSGLIKSD